LLTGGRCSQVVVKSSLTVLIILISVKYSFSGRKYKFMAEARILGGKKANSRKKTLRRLLGAVINYLTYPNLTYPILF
jgi:hypothetical protein